MVYECPQCKTPLPPGASSCARCGLQFATPIPADATLPASGASHAYDETAGYDGSTDGDGQPPRRVVAIVASLCIILIIIAAFAVYSFNHNPAPTDAGPIVTAPAVPRPNVSSSPAQSGPTGPVTLAPGTSPGSTAQSSEGALVGRWQSKSMDIYVFNADGTGSRGNGAGGKSESFTWVVTGNELVINASKEEKLTFNMGPDSNTLYLRLANGHYAQFQRAGAA